MTFILAVSFLPLCDPFQRPAEESFQKQRKAGCQPKAAKQSGLTAAHPKQSCHFDIDLLGG